MRIVTYNVNGLRARIVPYKSLHGFLSTIDADIICVQETKLSKQELTADIAIAQGYESFFSCTRTYNKGKIGYSGVATFCRIPVTDPCTSAIVPIAADEGFTGLLHSSKEGDMLGDVTRVGFYEDVLKMMPREELLQLDSEGRCIVTDHGNFVLFNIYGPNIPPGDTMRMEFKLKFYKALQCRWENLLRVGKRLIIVGDLNISPFRIDTYDPGPHFDSNPCRKWLQSLLDTQGGPLTDIYRTVHSQKKDAYTCWSQASGAEEFNCGSRIDLILSAGSCSHAESVVDTQNHHSFGQCDVEDCDIMVQFKRFKDGSIPRHLGNGNVKLEGSDHAPVFVRLKEQAPVEPHVTPSFAVRFLPQLRGRQQNIDTLFQKRSLHAFENVGLDEETISTGNNAVEMLDAHARTQEDQGCSSKPLSALKVQKLQKFKKTDAGKNNQRSLFAFFNQPLGVQALVPNTNTNKQTCISGALDSSITNLSICSQKENNNMAVCSAEDASDIQTSAIEVSYKETSQESSQELDIDVSQGCETNDDEVHYQKSEMEVKGNARSEWKKIQNIMAKRFPLCKGHREPCVAHVVKKAGPNLGRGFYVCARAKGPPSNPEARCNHFEWASTKLKRSGR